MGENGGKVWAYRTQTLGEDGVRSVWYFPDGTSLHGIERHPIPPGRYFLRPDDTGRFQNWVIERAWGSRCAVPGELGSARSNVEVHVGNELDESRGCPLLGFQTTETGVGTSRLAIEHARTSLRRDDPDPPFFTLEIVG